MTESVHRSSGFHQIIRNGFSNLGYGTCCWTNTT